MMPSRYEPLTRRHLKLLLKELDAEQAGGTVLVSLYVPPSQSLQAVKFQLMEEAVLAENIKNREVRQGVSAALTGALSTLRTLSAMPANGVVLFESATRSLLFVPPDRVPSKLYRCDSRYVLDPLREMVEDPTLFGLIVIDRAEATVGFLRGRRVETSKSIASHLLGKHDAGGQSQRRFERIMENEALQFYRRTAELANVLFGPFVDRLDGILVGGPGRTKDEFLADEGLRYDLRAKVLPATFNTGYTDDQGLRELVKAAADVLKDTLHAKEQRVLEQFFTLLKSDASRVTYGAADVRTALGYGQVQTLILGEEVPEFDDLAARAHLSHATVVPVGEESDLGRQFVFGFGGIGAILRYALGPQ